MYRWVTLLLPSDALTFEEKCWNQFPYVRTEYSVHRAPFAVVAVRGGWQCAYFGEKLQFYVESIHLADNGSTDNVHNIDVPQPCNSSSTHDLGCVARVDCCRSGKWTSSILRTI